MHQSELARKISFCHLKKKDKKITLRIKKSEFVHFQKNKMPQETKFGPDLGIEPRPLGKPRYLKNVSNIYRIFLCLLSRY